MAGTWYLQRGRGDPLGPFSSEEILDGLRKEQIPRDCLVREVSATAWLPLAGVPEFNALLPAPTEVDPERLAPVAGPAWVSGSERHGARTSGTGTGPVSGTAPTMKANPALRGLAAPAASTSAPSRPPPRHRAPASTDDASVPASHRTVGALIAAVGIVWASVRIGSLVAPPVGWSSLVKSFPLLATHAALDGAVAVAVYPALFAGVLRAHRARASFGRALVRGAAWVGLLGHAVLGSVALVFAVRSPSWKNVVAPANVAAMIVGGPLVLVACLVVLRRLYPDDGEAPGFGGDSSLLALFTAAIAALVYGGFTLLHLAGSPLLLFGS